MQHIPMPPPPAPPRVYATFWARFGALLIDGLILSPLWIAFTVRLLSEFVPETVYLSKRDEFNPFEMGRMYRVAFGWIVLISAVTFAYNALMVRYKGATVGKMALSIRVLRGDGSPAGWREALLRPVLQAATTFAGGVPGVGLLNILDYLWMLWDDQKQTIHDKIAGTIVVRQQR